MDRILISECEVDIANGDLVLTHRFTDRGCRTVRWYTLSKPGVSVVRDGDHYVVTRGAA